MYCSKCGKMVDDGASFCPHCGSSLNGNGNVQQNNGSSGNVQDTGSIGWAFLGFFFPLIGLILFLCWKDTAPLNAKMAGKGALIGVIVEVVLGIILGIVWGSLIGSMLYC